jgi:hypothetical protein
LEDDRPEDEYRAPEERAQCDLMRCIFHSPFHPMPAIPSVWLAWNDHTIQRIAEAIYDAGDFDRLPVLADALEDAGCGDADILAHCRSDWPHVRGCWAVDLVLGRR